MPEGVRAGAVYYDVLLSRDSLRAVRAEAQKVGKELDAALNKSRANSGAGKSLEALQRGAKAAAAEIERLREEERAGTKTREEYARAIDALRKKLRSMSDEATGSARGQGELGDAIRQNAGLAMTLRREYENNVISQKEFTDQAEELRVTLLRQAAQVDRTSAEYDKAQLGAQRLSTGLATARGETSKLGLSANVATGAQDAFRQALGRLGPAGDLAAGAMGIMNSQADALTDVFGVRLPGAMRNSLKVISTLQVLAPVALGAAAFGLYRLANAAAETAVEIDRGAQMTGLSTDAYQSLAYAFSQASIEQEDFLDITAELNQVMGEAARGEARLADQFIRLGVDIRTATGEMRGTEDVLMDTVRALEAIPEPSRRAGEAVELFGDDVGRKLLTLVNLGADSIVRLREEARELGLVISGDAIMSLVDYRNEMAVLQQQLQTARIEITASFLPVLRDAVIPLLQNHLVPWLQNAAERLDTLATRFTDSGEAGELFRGQIAAGIEPVARFGYAVGGTVLSVLGLGNALIGGLAGGGAAIGTFLAQVEQLVASIDNIMPALERGMAADALMKQGRLVEGIPELFGALFDLGAADLGSIEWDLFDSDAIEAAATEAGQIYRNAAINSFSDANSSLLKALSPDFEITFDALRDALGEGAENLVGGAAGAGTGTGAGGGAADAIVKEAGAIRDGVSLLQQEFEQELIERDAYVEAVEGYWDEVEALLARASTVEQRAAVLDVRGTVAGLLPDGAPDATPGRISAAAGGMQTDWAARRAAEQADLMRTLARDREEQAAAEAEANERRVAGRERTRSRIRRILGEEQADLARALDREIEGIAAADERRIEGRERTGDIIRDILDANQRDLVRGIERERERQEAAARARVDARERTASIIRNLIEADQRDLTAAIERERERQEAAEAAADERRIAGQESTSARIRRIVEEEQAALTRAIEKGREDREAAEREAAARVARDNAARAGIAESLAPGREAAQRSTTILDEYGASLERVGIHAALFGETHELSARQAEITRQVIEQLIPVLGDEHETVQDLIDAWLGYSAAAEEAEKETATLADHFGNAEAVLSSLGSAAGGTLGDVIGGFGGVAGIAKDLASGNYLTAATSVITEIVGAITAVGDAGRAAREELADLQADLNLINLDALTVTNRQRVGQFLFIPIYADLEVLPEEVQELAQTVQSGMASGFQQARDIIVAGGTMRDAREAIRQGLREAVLDGILQGFLQSQAMQILFADEMARIIDLTLDGHTDAARAAMANLDDEIDAATDLLTSTLESWVEEPIEIKIKPTFVMPDTVLTKMAPSSLASGVADSLASGVESGLSSGVRAYLESGNLADLEGGLEEGIFGSVTDALVKALVEEGIVKGALGRYLPMIGQAFAAGDTDRAIAISQRMMDLIPGLAAQLGAILDPLRGLMPGEATTPGTTPSNNGGIQVQEITGPTRDMFMDLFSPLRGLDSLVGIETRQLDLTSRTYDLLAARLPGPAALSAAAVGGGSTVINIEPGAVQITGTRAGAIDMNTLDRELGDSITRALRARGR